MNQWASLKCFNCDFSFNSSGRLPKILPCSKIMCLSCVKYKNLQKFVHCNYCLTNRRDRSEELPTSIIILNLVNQNPSECINNKDQNLNIAKFHEKLKFELLDGEIIKIDDKFREMVFLIDIKAEKLIQQIHHLTNKQLNEIQKRKDYIQFYFNIDEIKNKSDLNAAYKALCASDSASFLYNLNQLKRLINDSENLNSYFIPNSSFDFENFHFGKLINTENQNIIYKVNTINSLFKEQFYSFKFNINLDTFHLNIDFLPLNNKFLLLYYSFFYTIGNKS